MQSMHFMGACTWANTGYMAWKRAYLLRQMTNAEEEEEGEEDKGPGAGVGVGVGVGQSMLLAFATAETKNAASRSEVLPSARRHPRHASQFAKKEPLQRHCPYACRAAGDVPAAAHAPPTS